MDEDGTPTSAGTSAAEEAYKRRFEIAAEAAGLGVWHWDLMTNLFDYSPRAREIYGLPRDGLLSYEQISGVTHPEDAPRTHEIAARSLDPGIKARESYRYRIFRHDDGALRWVMAFGQAIFAEVEGGMRALSYVGTLQDITDQKRSEDALAESEERLRLAVDAGQLAVWELDLASGHVRPSAQLNRFYGFPPDAEPSLEALRARYAPGEAERIDRLAAEARARGDTQIEMTIKLLWPDRTAKWLLIRAEAAPPVNGSGPRVIGVAIDITGRKHAEEALAQSERRLRMSQDAAGIASLDLDIASGEVHASDMFWKIWGLSPRETIHISALENIVLPEDASIRSTPQTRRAGTAAPSVEYRIRRPDDGQLRWLSRQIEFIHDAAGKPVRMVGVMQDITERKAAEARQQTLMHELEHRIKNILATVSAIAARTLRNADLDSAREAFLERLRTLSEAHDLLTETRWTQAQLGQVVRAALSPHQAPGRIAIAGPDVWLTPRHALSLALAVNELATNAVKYGALSLETGRVDVAWALRPDSGTGKARLNWQWRETGGPPVLPPLRRGFGSFLIERVLATDFQGDVDVSYLPNGFACVLDAPVPTDGSAAEP